MMEAVSPEIVKSIGELLNLIGSQYQITCEDGILRGQRKDSGQQFILARRRNLALKVFEVEEKLSGYDFIDLCCQQFRELARPLKLHQVDEAFAQMVRERLSTLNHQRSFID